MGVNKDKILIVLYSSKTHDVGSHPQQIKIVSNKKEKLGNYLHRNFCPFMLLHDFISIRGNYDSDSEQFFVFRDKFPVTAGHARNLLKSMISNLGLEARNYGMHSLRIGRTSDLIRYNYPLDEVRRMGRWRSNTVFKYIRDI